MHERVFDVFNLRYSRCYPSSSNCKRIMPKHQIVCVLFRWLFSSACHLLLVVVVVFLFIRRNDRQCYCVKREHTISFQCCCKCNRFSLWAFGFLTFKTNITWMRRRLLLFRMHWADDLNKWEKMMRPRTANREMQRRAAEGEDRWGEK